MLAEEETAFVQQHSIEQNFGVKVKCDSRKINFIIIIIIIIMV